MEGVEEESEKKEEEQKAATDEDVESKKQQPQYLGVHEMVYNSINSCDIDLRPLLFNNVVVTGGNTLFSGFNERLNYELPLKAPGVSAYFIFLVLCLSNYYSIQ